MHVCIISQNHISRNPRVLKEAEVWLELGHRVTIGTLWYNADLLALDILLLKEKEILNQIKYEAYTDIRETNIKSIYYRTEFRCARILKKYLGIESIQLGGYGTKQIMPWLIEKKPDLISCHQEIACLLIHKIESLKIKYIVDFEDWYSKDLLPEDQKLRPIELLKKAEKHALENALFTITPSSSMSKAMHDEYGGTKPHVIYNSFSEKLRKNTFIEKERYDINKTLKVAWISQWIGHGRGLEKMIAYLIELNIPIEIHLAGNIRKEYSEKLTKSISEYKSVTIHYHPIQHPTEIVSWLSNYDAGLACEPTTSYSTDLTISNKMFYYLLAGIPIIGFYTQGQAEIAIRAPKAIMLCDKNTEASSIIKSWVSNPKIYREAKEESYALGSELTWENQSIKLKNIIELLNQTN